MHCIPRFKRRSAFTVVVHCGMLTACLEPAILLRAQEIPARTVTAVEFTGRVQTGEAYLRDIVGVSAGDRFDPAVLDEAVARLLSTGRFISASYRVKEETGGVRIIFEVREPPRISSIRFVGNRKFSEGQLKDQVPLKPGDAVDRFAIRDGREAIIAMYREAGYNEVAVSYDQEELDRSGELVYTVEEGKRIRIRRIVFEGNDTLPDRELKRHIDSKTAFWIIRTGAFDEERARSDAARLQAYYRDQGFLDAGVGFRTELSEDGKDLTIVFTIEEGSRYAIEAIEFRGNAALTREELLALMTSRAGETVKRSRIDADVRAIRRRYGQLGYIYATVRAIRVFSETPGLVRITVKIDEGQPYRVGRVIVRGNKRTKDKVVRRALNLYPPDDLFDLTEAREAEKRLLETRIFSSARIYPVGDQPGVRDVVIDVQESPKAGDFLFGLGVTSNSGLVGNVVLNLQNFDLFDWPRSWSEFIKFRSFFGAGQRLRLELQPGTVVSRFRIDFTEPYLLDMPLRFDLSAYLFERGRDGYSERRGGASVSFGKRFEHGRLRGWSGELALGVENVRIDDLDIFAARRIRDDEGSNLLTSIKVTMVRDRTDNRFIPSEGDRLRFGYEQFGILGGDHLFGKVTAGYTWYTTLHTDVLERKSVLQLRAEGGAIIGDAPVFERFYGGGTGSIRGFQFRGVGPREGIDDNNVGGEFLLLMGGEYSFPLIGNNVRGLFFLDSGMVGSGPWRASVGAGVRFTIEVFGPVPLELDLAVPVSSDPDDEEQIFSFLVGTLF